MRDAAQPRTIDFDTDESRYPIQVLELFDREREVAMIVYNRGATTAVEVQQRLSVRLTNGAVRSMLNRLVAKHILRRHRRGRHGAFLYLPAINNAVVVERAVKQLADDYFGGSIHRTAAAIDEIVARAALRPIGWRVD